MNVSDATTLPIWARCLKPIGTKADQRALVRLVEWVAMRVAELTADRRQVTVVLVSRRMSCLYEMLVANGYPEIKGATVVSDRALGGSVQLRRGDTVVLVDDAIILGSTLVDLYDRIVNDLEGDRGQVEVMVAWIDDERHSPAFVEHLQMRATGLGAPLVKSTKELENIAWDIASALYQDGRPYFTDFPLVEELHLTNRAVDALLTSKRWMVTEVTPPVNFSGGERRAFSFVPTPGTDALIRTRVCPDAAALMDIGKVRCYFGQQSRQDEDDAVSLRLVPMGIPGAVMPKRLDEVLGAVEKVLGATGLPWRKWKPVACHRLLQMYLSSCVLTEFWVDLEAAGCTRILDRSVLDAKHLLYYFGADDADMVLDAFERTVDGSVSDIPGAPAARALVLTPRSGLPAFEKVTRRALTNSRMIDAARNLHDQLEPLASAVTPDRPKPGVVATVDPFWVYRILNLFGCVDRDLERPQEERLQHKTYEFYKEYRDLGLHPEIGARVIKSGISLPELQALMQPDADRTDPWPAAALLLAIDVGNDLGVVVPTTVYDEDMKKGPVFRYYRSGEMAFSANVPHDELARGDRSIAPAQLDRLTLAWLKEWAERDGIDDLNLAVQTFMKDNRRLAEQACARSSVRQAWVAEVADMDEDDLLVDAESRLVEGVSTKARLPRSALSEDENAHVAVGSVLYWTVFDSRDLQGLPRPTYEIRLIPSTRASDR